MISSIHISEYRKNEHGVDSVFISRWSPRAMSAESISKEELMRLVEAARWAPSSFNNQPWRFLYAMRDTANWDTYFDLLADANKEWAGSGAVLIVIVSKRTFDHNGKPARTHSFDAGAAWQSLALQGSIMGLVVHGMQGFDYDRAREVLGVTEEYQVEVMVVVGRPGKRSDLPDKLREKEFPSGRKRLSEIVFEGSFLP